MAFEIIRRKEGEMHEKQQIQHEYVQVSINDWGHLVIREFDDPIMDKACCGVGPENCEKYRSQSEYACNNCEHYKLTRTDDEHLIVFDKATTDRIIDFIFSIRSSHELKQLLKDMIEKKK